MPPVKEEFMEKKFMKKKKIGETRTTTARGDNKFAIRLIMGPVIGPDKIEHFLPHDTATFSRTVKLASQTFGNTDLKLGEASIKYNKIKGSDRPEIQIILRLNRTMVRGFLESMNGEMV